MEKRKPRNVGNIYTSYRCGDFEVLEIFRSKRRALCKFLDTGYVTEVEIRELRDNGSVKDYFIPSVCGIGIIGNCAKVKGYSKTKVYKVWSHMLIRISDSEKFLKVCPRYRGCKVEKKWLWLSKFSKDFIKMVGYEDMISHPEVKYNLDKDIFSMVNKTYSLNTCCLIPRELNLFITNKQVTNSTGREGVSYIKHENAYTARMKVDGKAFHIGYYRTLDEAYSEYINAKLIRLNHLLSNKYSFINERIKDGIRSFISIKGGKSWVKENQEQN